MDKILLHEYRIPINGVKKKTIYHMSDLHLAECDELSDAAETEISRRESAFFRNFTRDVAIEHNEPYDDGHQFSPGEYFKNLTAASSDGDALVLTGDIFHFTTGANIRLANKLLSDFPAPILAVSGNHDNAKEIPEECILSEIKNPIVTLDLGDLLLLGIDNSSRTVTRGQNEAVREILKAGKPTVIALHIPFMTEDTRKIFEGIGEGFRMNYDGCPPENTELLNIIAENSQSCAAVLAGHTHFAINGKIAGTVPMYVASQSVTGHLNKYIIGE